MSGPHPFNAKSALAFVVSFGIVSLFADAAYEGMRGISGPFLATLGASGFAVGLIAGFGELFGYTLRLLSGRLADSTRAYWPITLLGYVVQMLAVPALALAGNWQAAAVLIVLERVGKAIRNPPRDVMLSRAGEHIGQGWAFGLHEILDQVGAMSGPLAAALVLAIHHDYREAFAWLAIPSAATLVLVFALRFRYGAVGASLPASKDEIAANGFPRAFWLYAAASALVAFGFSDFTLISFHFGRVGTVRGDMIAVFYAAAMASAGIASLLFGRWFDRAGLKVIFPGIVIGLAVAPLAFFGGTWAALAASLAWGASLGVHEAVMSAAVAKLVPLSARARAYGIFTALFGAAWFAGSALLGALYDVSLVALVAAATLAQLLAFVPLWLAVRAAPTG
ncbi:MAG: MFS transporter [Alphaproteobacteria bacterium]|nr:MFS transporter [Alphaproteobacteria bacterium]MDE2109659.1 MFS transporter [Alphaproteobacteria bacterium]